MNAISPSKDDCDDGFSFEDLVLHPESSLLCSDTALEESLGAILNSPCPGAKKTTVKQEISDVDGSSESPTALNAVHMEVQENAKIPNTYNVPVRRNVEGRPGIGMFMDEIMRLTEADMALTESFLGSNFRSAQSTAYSNAGALMSSIGTKVAEISSSDVESKEDVKEEVDGNNLTRDTSSEQKKNDTASENDNIIKTNLIPKPLGRQIPQQSPYGRPVPLPIPTIATSQPHSGKPKLPNNETRSSSQIKRAVFPSSIDTSLSTAAIQNVKNGQKITTQCMPKIPSLPTKVSTVAKSPTPFMLDATKRRSQFGFAGNHKVPAVPKPPQKRRPQVRKPPNKNPARMKALGTAVMASKSSATEGSSYERKKQRAKDARVKLNEAIERLSVAMNVAGMQSKERIKTHKGWSISPSGCDRTNTISTINIMEEVSKTADSAKKWDRPSFVGTAASIVQHLNSECEALMRELVQMKKERAEWIGSQQNASFCRKRKIGEYEHSNNVSEAESFDNDDESSDKGKVAARKKKRSESVDIYSVFQYERVSIMIGYFLDPQSAVRAATVSRTWQCQLGPFLKSDTVWSNFCLSRFGSAPVREWQHHCNDDLESQLPFQNHGQISMINLYQRMNTSNVKPKCHFEGGCPLGHGKIHNVVSAWASLVERSNGETRRSVLTIEGGNTKYASLPVVELRIIIQNVGIAGSAIHIPEQIIAVDASTKRSRGAEMFEISSDSRFKKKLMNLDGSMRETLSTTRSGIQTLAHLPLFESTMMCAFIHATSCPTMQKFRAKAKYVKVLVNVRGTTLPLVIPFAS